MVNKKSSSSKMMEEDTIPETEVSKDFINFFVDQLKDMYWAKKHQAKTLPKIQKAATAPCLKDVFTSHIATNRLQEERLEQVFELLGETPRVKKCEAMVALIEEANEVMQETEKGSNIRDAGLLLAAQKVGYYEIASYDTLLELARTLGNEDIISLLEEALAEEKEADELLTIIAEGGISKLTLTADAQKQPVDEIIADTYDSVNLTGKNTNK